LHGRRRRLMVVRSAEAITRLKGSPVTSSHHGTTVMMVVVVRRRRKAARIVRRRWSSLLLLLLLPGAAMYSLLSRCCWRRSTGAKLVVPFRLLFLSFVGMLWSTGLTGCIAFRRRPIGTTICSTGSTTVLIVGGSVDRDHSRRSVGLLLHHHLFFFVCFRFSFATTIVIHLFCGECVRFSTTSYN
jgi:hypothetical protein